MKKVVLGAMILLAGFGMEVARAADIALLVSDNVRDGFFTVGGRYGVQPIPGDPDPFSCSKPNFIGPDEYMRYYLGWDYVLAGQPNNSMVVPTDSGDPGLPDSYDPYPSYEPISDEQLTEQYLTENNVKLLILSNAASLTDAQSREVQQWVLKGGNLIATFGSGYKDIIQNPHDPDGSDPLKSQKGATSGLHQLWHDPWTKAFGTNSIAGDPGIDVLITKIFGPTAVELDPPQADWVALFPLSYGAEANLLTQRPEHFRDALAFLTFDGEMDALRKLYPAILLTRMSRGQVVYFAFAPEFIVSLAFDLAGHCSVDKNYSPFPDVNDPADICPVGGCGNPAEGTDPEDLPNGYIGDNTATDQVNTNRVRPLLLLMKQTIDFMLTQ